MKTYTIHSPGSKIEVRDENGDTIATRSTYCNPAALRQVILDAERAGGVIDWEKSSVANPDADITA